MPASAHALAEGGRGWSREEVDEIGWVKDRSLEPEGDGGTHHRHWCALDIFPVIHLMRLQSMEIVHGGRIDVIWWWESHVYLHPWFCCVAEMLNCSGSRPGYRWEGHKLGFQWSARLFMMDGAYWAPIEDVFHAVRNSRSCQHWWNLHGDRVGKWHRVQWWHIAHAFMIYMPGLAELFWFCKIHDFKDVSPEMSQTCVWAHHPNEGERLGMWERIEEMPGGIRLRHGHVDKNGDWNQKCTHSIRMWSPVTRADLRKIHTVMLPLLVDGYYHSMIDERGIGNWMISLNGQPVP